MPTQDRIEYIERYINIKASEDDFQEGKNLYHDGNVALTYSNDASDTWHFSVQDTRKHTVMLRDLNRKELNTKCTCASVWGSICKHTVASLLFIADGGKHAVTSETQDVNGRTSLRTSLGYLYEKYRFISLNDIEDHSSNSVMNEILHGYNDLKLEDIKIGDDEIIFEYQTYYNSQFAVIQYKEGKVYISSGNKNSIPKLNKVEAKTLLLIAQSESPDLLEVLFSPKIEDMKKEHLSKFGLSPDEDFGKFFSITFYPEQGGLTFAPRPDQKGLLPVSSGIEKPFRNFVDELNEDALKLDHIPKKGEERLLAFVLDFDLGDEESNYDNTEFRVSTIVGKPNKNRTLINSHIDQFDELTNTDHISISANAKEIINNIERLYNTNSPKAVFAVKRHLLHLLSKEPLVYVRNEVDYKIKKSDLQKVEISAKPVTAKYETFEDDNFVGLKLQVFIEDEVIQPEDIDPGYRKIHLFNLNNKLYVPSNYNVARHIENWNQELKMVKSHKEHFFNEIVLPLSKNFEIDFTNDGYGIDSIELDFRKKQVYLSELHDFLIITPQVEYHHGVSVVLNHAGNVLVKDDGTITEYKRNLELEDEFIESISALHPYFEEQVEDKVFYLHYDSFTKDMWFYDFFEQMQNMEVEVFGLKDLKNFKYSPYAGKVTTNVTSGQDWFEVDIQVSFGDNKVALKDIRKAVLNQQKYIQLKDGTVGMLPTEWLHKLEKFFRHGEIKDDKLTVSNLRFSIIDELFDDIDDANILTDIAQKRKRLQDFKEISETNVPKEINAELRSYQKEGLNWLNFLDEMGWGGILADDMGLGKTLQILTFLQHVVKENDTPNLIIVPTTLLFNWEREIAKFAPELSAYYHYGVNRTKEVDDFKDYQLVFSTYGILLRDIEMLCQFKFNYVILDESQAIKNPASRRFKAASLINSNNRIALSGTPIENSTFDLYAQMSFVNKGFFGGATAFREGFSNAIDKDGNENIAAELQRLINPFILRRTKERVASELPSKTEDVIYCEMDTEQRRVYDAYRNNFKNQLLGQVEEQGIGKSKLMVLEALTRLRQICDSPVLLNDDNIGTTDSVKIKEIIQHITDKTANHKILIFSQFVKMLGLVKSELIKRNIEFEYLDGQSTPVQRERSVSNFQENDKLRVFLISLKAGGTGLNLTAADYVYILDPWWNPAVENQAIDRCYRIGQDKKVFAYRMICKDTVEEKILNLQNKKKKIAGDIVQTDESIMKTLQADDIRQLFS
ncbi:hypothetical protein E9993_12370 [Labilibacter sediminis]|nr:hypothetical protein E9993_12370 [Labilibacter sediminis]